MLVWVVGAGGQLGRAVSQAAQHDDAALFRPGAIDWANPHGSRAQLSDALATFNAAAGVEPWAVAWCAGASVVASTEAQTEQELLTLTAFVDELSHAHPSGPGAVFLASSAGGVYAGSAAAPFTAESAPRPVSPYGQLKLQQELAVTSALDGRLPVVIGRLSNLYGPSTNPGKGQGLIPSLCRATVHRRPLNLYVSMDTIRDYLYADDAGLLTWQAICGALNRSTVGAAVEVIASGSASTVADVIATVQSVAHRRVPLALGTDRSAQHQAIDLRMTPSRHLLGGRDLVPLASGIKRVLDAVASEAA